MNVVKTNFFVKNCVLNHKIRIFYQLVTIMPVIYRFNVTYVTKYISQSIYFCTIFIYKIKKMKKNMGSADKIIRFVIAAVIAVLFFTDVISGTLGIVLLVLAGVFVLTSFISFCPLYLPFGIKTCRAKEEK